MLKIRQIIVAGLTFVIFLLVISPHGAFAQNAKIGLLLPLSGNAAPLGRQFLAGSKLALQLLPEAANIELIISDDGCDKDLAQLAIDDIRNASVVLITGFLCNEPVYRAADELKGKDIPLLIAAARSNRILKDRARNSWNVWQMSARDSDISLSAFRHLSHRWRQTPYAIVDDGTVFGRTQADEFRALMEEAGNKPTFVDNFRPAQSTQAGLIRRLSKSGVDAAYIAAGADDVALIGRNMKEFGKSIEIATGEAASILPYQENIADIPVGLLAIMPTPLEEIPAIETLKEKISAAKLQPEPYLVLGYATMQLVAQYLQDAETSLEGKKYNTVLGDYEFDATGSNIASHYQLFRWNGKKFTNQISDLNQ